MLNEGHSSPAFGKGGAYSSFPHKKIPEGNEIGMVNPYTFTSWRTLKAIPNLFYCITVFRSLGVGSFFNLLKENFMNVCLKSDMGLKKKCLHHLWPGRSHCSRPIRDLQSFAVPSGEERESRYGRHAEQYHRVIQRTKGLLEGEKKILREEYIE